MFSSLATVHLADPFPHAALQAVPREKDVPKAGMMESLLEQMRKVKRDGGRVPHFSYASSYEVYPYATNATIEPLRETMPISTPSSLRGASKLIDEVLAKLYYDEHDMFSVGLRFFSVYGPWSVPGSPLFEMAERAVVGQVPTGDPHWSSVHDYVYIDDAVDAIMTAMQYRPQGEKPHPLVLNVASGTGSSLEDIAKIMGKFFPSQVSDNRRDEAIETVKRTVAIGSTQRAEQLLGYQPQISLQEGIELLLAWHYDRAYPYGGHHSERGDKSSYIATKGILSCLPNDTECLKGAPVFPCASECSHEAQCTTSFYDEIIGWTQALTTDCENVMYTVDLNDSLESIPSAHVKVKMTSDYSLEGPCNLAFVSESSKLVQSKRNSNPSPPSGDTPKLLKDGIWILVPVSIPSFSTGDENLLSLLPKLSPGLFFGPKVSRAIYVDPDILLDSVSKLLQEASMQPLHDDVEGATAMLIGKGKPKDYFAQDEDDFQPKKQQFESSKSMVQNAAYRMIRIAVSDKLFGDGFMALLDSRWMVHTLQSDDSRLFRCDVFGEVTQWEVDTDRSALEFVLGLHDMWSRVITEKPWWIDENVITVPEAHDTRRRLEEVVVIEEGLEADRKVAHSTEDNPSDADEKTEEIIDEDVDEDNEEDDGAAVDAETLDEGDQNEDDEFENELESEDGEGEEGDEHRGFGVHGEEGVEAAAGDKSRGGSSDQDDDVQGGEGFGEEIPEDFPLEERDFSAYDTWMGVLSASSVKYFVRIVPSSEVGVVSLEEYKN